ncbi:MAG: FadR family transcriptional regulator [Proteobacteria bacterium]|nr:FadR family transcriptional regulator [Pseudomonadota bacterium]MCP4917275.1 FadR family transcriptional regulator [Pseudomonadota bacterium]
MSFSPVKRAKVSDQVAGTIRDAIVRGDYAPGAPLPAERLLAEQFGVNRSSVREALHRLEAWGLVEIKHGAGARVTDFLASAGLQLLPFLIAPGGQLDAKLLGDLLELRVEFLGFTAAGAASRASDAGVAELERILTALEGPTTMRERQELDFDFFQQLVDLSQNKVLGMLSNAIRRVYLQNAQLFALMYASPVDTTFHRDVLDALRSGAPDAARLAMRAYGQSALGVMS